MKEFKCKNIECNSNEVFIEETGTQTGLYCAECGKWIKWLNKDEKRLAERYIENYSVNHSPNKNDDFLFLGMNITETVLNKMLKIKQSATKGMTKSELEAYEMGVSNTLAYLQVLLTDSEHVVVNTFSKAKEYTYEELKAYYERLSLI